ncbi:hypothetical protein FRB97_007469 [Tulasnella sp. 331]|nr:hypothetical protein FRB97_007469 [Tulasnella sp. 331]KAG8876105.1 hypothetical protein FRB98_007458 [Tulasnella sp. 332]
MARLVHPQSKLIANAFVLTPEQASVKYLDSGVAAGQILAYLNNIFKTSLTLDHPDLRKLLEGFVSQSMDFGAIYARVRSCWPDPHASPDTLFEGLSAIETFGTENESDRDNSVSGQTIHKPYNIKPRRLWDLYAHRVIPFHYSLLEGNLTPQYWAISHSWTNDMAGVDTAVNEHEWPVPLPVGVTLEAVRTELLKLGAQYVWLDILCLRQFSSDPVSENKRKKEWSVDVPTIGLTYINGTSQVVRYMNGLGRAFERSGWGDPRHWLNRAWTLQEMKFDSIIAGGPDEIINPEEERSDETGELLSERLALVGELEVVRDISITASEFMTVIAAMKRRFSTNPVDKIAGVAMLFSSAEMPLYNEAKSEEDAWALCVRHLPRPVIAELLFQFVTLGDGGVTWRPSWRQLMAAETPTCFVSRSIDAQVETILDEGHAVYEGPSLTTRFTPLAYDGQSQYRHGIVQVKVRRKNEQFKVAFSPLAPVIPEGEYALVGDQNLGRWILCTRKDGPKLQKMTVVNMKDDDSDELRNTGSVTRRRWHFT